MARPALPDLEEWEPGRVGTSRHEGLRMDAEEALNLDRVIGFAVECGASVRLIGDVQQPAAIGAGGVLRDIAATYGAVRLDEVVRFDDPTEADASLALGGADPGALGSTDEPCKRSRTRVGLSPTEMGSQ